MSFDRDRADYESNVSRPMDPSMASEPHGPVGGSNTMNDDTMRRLDAALHSPNSVDKLLVRLKQSIFSAREFSSFLKERCALEDRHAQGYKKLIRNANESVRRAEARQGSYARNFEESLKVNERIAENGLAFASSLHTMSEELRDVAENAEKGRKNWKRTTMDAEKKLAEAESAQQKAKDRYNNAAEQYERVKTGEKHGGKFGLKNKSPAQQEEALKEKTDVLDQDYATKSEAAQTQRRDFEQATRPQIVRALKELIDECDAALAMQMAKLASVTEKHVVSNGMAIAPIKMPNSDIEPRGLRQIAMDIDDRKDFADYMLDGVEPPPQFKGRSRRNTDAEIMNSSAQRDDTVETPYNVSQPNLDSRAPQLPQIGGSEAFSRSFEAERPANQNRNSYLGGQSDALNSHPTNQSQQTGIANDPAPSLPSGRGMGPSLPSHDRGQSLPPSEPSGHNGFGRGQGYPRQESIPIPTGRGRPSIDNTFYGRDQGPVRQDPTQLFSTDSQSNMGDGFNRTQGPLRPEIMPSFAGRGQPVSGDPLADRSQGPPRQDSMPPAAGRGQPLINTMNVHSDRVQDENRGYPMQGPKVGGYMDGSKQQSPVDGSGTGRGQGPQSPVSAGRGGLLVGRNALPSQQQYQPQRPTLPPNRPVFGMPLNDLFRRDGPAVPAVVSQCILAVDMYGLSTQGIYRVSGASPVVQQLKSEFDHDSSQVNLTDREMFRDDIATVATLLKNFLRDLPDPLLTSAAYHSFIQAARFDENIRRRDALHEYINSLPDPNYATLRALVLHLHRVSMNSEVNKMDIKNLAIVFGPTVMGSGNMADAGLQTKVMETILHHTHDIFDPDE